MRGDDYDATEPLSVTFSAGSVLGDQIAVPITIHDDFSVDGLKDFTAEVVTSALVMSGSVATIFISDNDSECTLHILPLHSHCYAIAFCNMYGDIMGCSGCCRCDSWF